YPVIRVRWTRDVGEYLATARRIPARRTIGIAARARTAEEEVHGALSVSWCRRPGHGDRGEVLDLLTGQNGARAVESLHARRQRRGTHAEMTQHEVLQRRRRGRRGASLRHHGREALARDVQQRQVDAGLEELAAQGAVIWS